MGARPNGRASAMLILPVYLADLAGLSLLIREAPPGIKALMCKRGHVGGRTQRAKTYLIVRVVKAAQKKITIKKLLEDSKMH